MLVAQERERKCSHSRLFTPDTTEVMIGFLYCLRLPMSNLLLTLLQIILHGISLISSLGCLHMYDYESVTRIPLASPNQCPPSLSARWALSYLSDGSDPKRLLTGDSSATFLWPGLLPSPFLALLVLLLWQSSNMSSSQCEAV